MIFRLHFLDSSPFGVPSASVTPPCLAAFFVLPFSFFFQRRPFFFASVFIFKADAASVRPKAFAKLCDLWPTLESSSSAADVGREFVRLLVEEALPEAGPLFARHLGSTSPPAPLPAQAQLGPGPGPSGAAADRGGGGGGGGGPLLMARHAAGVMRLVGSVIASVDRATWSLPASSQAAADLASLGRTHARMGIDHAQLNVRACGARARARMDRRFPLDSLALSFLPLAPMIDRSHIKKGGCPLPAEGRQVQGRIEVDRGAGGRARRGAARHRQGVHKRGSGRGGRSAAVK